MTETYLHVTRRVKLPDPVKLARYRNSPELGPRILFFSGGSALNAVSRELKHYTHNSVHLVTSFDSGGSSAKLRRAFDMPSIGDLRSRLIALADENITGNPEVYRLFTSRFPSDGRQNELLSRLDLMIRGKEPLVADIPNPMRRLIRTQLGYFRAAMPADFDLRGASTGNLILAGGYLNNHKHLDPIIFLFSKLVNVLGTVRAVVNDNLHLAACLDNGELVVGQHRLTGKETAPLSVPVSKLLLSGNQDVYVPASAEMRRKNRRLIEDAELICYPPGSFYTSLIANLLPQGVATAITTADCPRVYVPSLGADPEQVGMSVESATQTLLDCLQAGHGNGGRFLDYVLVDSRRGQYPLPLPRSRLAEQGIEIIDVRLISKNSAPYYDPELLVSALLSLT